MNSGMAISLRLLHGELLLAGVFVGEAEVQAVHHFLPIGHTVDERLRSIVGHLRSATRAQRGDKRSGAQARAQLLPRSCVHTNPFRLGFDPL